MCIIRSIINRFIRSGNLASDEIALAGSGAEKDLAAELYISKFHSNGYGHLLSTQNPLS